MIDRLDHFVLTVQDLNATRRFYCDCLGMEFVQFGENRQALNFGSSKINLHIAGKELEPKAHLARPGTADLCFILSGNLDAMIDRLTEFDIPLLEGPVPRTGATGPIQSVYVRDPDLNLVELSVYS